ncbi:hypothetical protein ABZ349_33260 [Streptomyces niveus]|uniref:hypothetical protein n=1 Tax=Streptomyces niveus TaxID=193462 RepID=UPI0033EB417F
MRRITAALATLAAAGATIVATPSGAEAATTWWTHDKNCETKAVGSACAEVQKRVTDSGAVTGYRGRLTVTPVSGGSITPTTYSWSSGGVLKDLCTGGCTPKTTAWASSWSPVQTTAGAYVARGTMTDDYLMIGVSWSAWTKVAGRCVTYSAGEVCVNRHERSYRNIGHERGQIQVKPKSGQWIEPRWVRVGHVVNGASNSQTTDLCDPSCTRRTSNWSGTTMRTRSGFDEGFAYASWALPSGAIKSMRVAYP